MLTINDNLCTNCLACYDVCPYYVIGKEEKTSRVFVRYPDQCRSCGHCIAVCPATAIDHTRLSRKDFGESPKIEIPPDKLKEYIVQRRSIRSYKDKAIDEQSLNNLLEVGAYGGTGANIQSVRFITITDKKQLRSLEKIVYEICWNAGLKFFTGKGLLFGLLARKFGSEITSWFTSYHDIFRYRRENNEMPGAIFRNAPSVILAHDLAHNPLGAINCAVALRNMELLAPAMGLGTCWTGYMITAALNKPKTINALLGIDETRRVYGGIMVGYPKYHYTCKIPRGMVNSGFRTSNISTKLS
jgi:nitroreductase/NAD-dependent dihydropyrimidine dehydrogenase PreA subunit